MKQETHRDHTKDKSKADSMKIVTERPNNQYSSEISVKPNLVVNL